jgi:FkbM family methyltransferase
MTYYGQFKPPVDEFLFERYFRGRATPGVSLECGAFDGVTECSCKFMEETLGWTSINVEAYPVAFDLLAVNRPRSINVQAALSDRRGRATFTAAVHPRLGAEFGNGSLAHLPEHRQELDDMGCTYTTFDVETLAYPDLLERVGQHRIDLFVLDVEGHELAVLEGMRGVPLAHLPRVFCVEFGMHGLEAVRRAVEPLGYVFDTTSNVNATFLRNDFPAMAGVLFAAGEPGLAWDATEMEEVLVELLARCEALEEENRRLTGTASSG